ncbi:MAG: hypothetical protein WAS36_02550 [Candidatus Saccharimonadales bacterium]
MKQKIQNFYGYGKVYVASEAFFWTLVGLFVAQTTYLAYMSAFQMAFDEAYHVRLIEFFSTHVNPIIGTQTSYFDVGNILHSPSWLYHYVLSYPYRLFQLAGSEQATIIGLRFLNVGIAVSSLLVARKILTQLGVAFALRNLVLGLLMFTPVFTLLSAQTNYDNAVVLVSFLLLSLSISIRDALFVDKTFPVVPLLQWTTLSCFGSLIKYSVLPIVIGTGIWIAIMIVRFMRHDNARLTTIKQSVRSVSKPTLYIWTGLLVGGMALFATYYGMNVVRYHNPVPQCNQVLDVEKCKQYYAWNRNYTLALNRENVPAIDGPMTYTYHWVVEVWYQMYAQIIPTGGIVPIAKFFYGSLLLLSALGVLATLATVKTIAKKYPALLGLTFVSFIYLLLLWSRNYHDYTNLGAAVAVQGRYLAPVLLCYYALLVLGVAELISNRGTAAKRFGLVLYAYTLLLFIIFGGFVGYILHVLPNAKW